MNKYLIDLHLVGFYCFFNWCAEENLVVNNKDNRVFMSDFIDMPNLPWSFV